MLGTLSRYFWAALLSLGMLLPAYAGGNDPLFINLTTDDAHRAKMGIMFGQKQAERGHPLTVFLNDKAVLIGAKAHAEKFQEHQKMLGELISKGAVVIICPMCMKHYGVAETDLLLGLQIGNPEVTGNALFKDHTRTLSW